MRPTLTEIPIVLTAFGTTAKAFSTYEQMDAVFEERFPHHRIHWAYSSRMVCHAVNTKKKRNLKDPLEMLQTLAGKGCPWVVIQSLHLTCGHEFDRLVAHQGAADIRSSIGLPLFTSHSDYEKVSKALTPILPDDTDRAVVLVGHGTDHPAWTAYPAFEAVMRQVHGNRIFTGVVEDFPGMDYTLSRIKQAGYKKVCLVPLMLVAGVHFKEDLTEDDDSWKKTFEKNDIHVTVVDQGIGRLDAVTHIFCDHIADALDVIPV